MKERRFEGKKSQRTIKEREAQLGIIGLEGRTQDEEEDEKEGGGDDTNDVRTK